MALHTLSWGWYSGYFFAILKVMGTCGNLDQFRSKKQLELCELTNIGSCDVSAGIEVDSDEFTLKESEHH